MIRPKGIPDLGSNLPYHHRQPEDRGQAQHPFTVVREASPWVTVTLIRSSPFQPHWAPLEEHFLYQWPCQIPPILWSSAEGLPPEAVWDCLCPRWSLPALTVNTVPLGIHVHANPGEPRTDAFCANVATWHGVTHSFLQLNSAKYSPTLSQALKIQDLLNPSPAPVRFTVWWRMDTTR